MRDVMLDLETMGNGPDAAILAIGAVLFDPVAGKVGGKFYVTVDLADSVRAGGVMDPATVLWWMRQSDAARGEFSRAGVSLKEALRRFSIALRQVGADTVRVWGNGAAFDNVVLAGAYQRCGFPVPWSYKNDRCYRTVAALAPQVTRAEGGTRHNALEDARGQARHLIEVFRVLGGGGGERKRVFAEVQAKLDAAFDVPVNTVDKGAVLVDPDAWDEFESFLEREVGAVD